MTVSTSIRGSFMIIQIENPPVNAIGAGVRQGLIRALDNAEAHAELDGVVICGQGGKAFSAGADIKEFGEPSEVALGDVVSRIESSSLPSLALINGVALGGGLELALACTYRYATTQSSFGLPEVGIGLIPGAGGTQRLPRIIGFAAAAQMVIYSERIDLARALETGLVDGTLHSEDFKAEALEQFQLTLKMTERPLPLHARSVDLGIEHEWWQGFKTKSMKRARGQISVAQALSSLENSTKMNLEQGLKAEREMFEDCRTSRQRTALSHVFFAERAIKKRHSMRMDAATDIGSVAVLGAGTMGAGIAANLAMNGKSVRLFDINGGMLDAGMARVEELIFQRAKKGKILEATAREQRNSVVPVTSLDHVNGVDLVIEAVVEDLSVKRSVFSKLDQICDPDTLLATNTSYLDINDIADGVRNPGRVLGLHFFSPAHVMKLLEIVRADNTSETTLATALQLADQIGKKPVIARVGDGFIGNRIFKTYRRQAEYILEDGCSPAEIDAAMRAVGFAMGPFEVSDLAGLDIGWHTRRREDATRDPGQRYVGIADTLYELNRLGLKTNAGWYHYEPGSRTPIPDPLIDQLAEQARDCRGLKKEVLTGPQISRRLLLAMANEGAKLLGEGIAETADDIDYTLRYGYGFPRHECGPMHLAQQLGLQEVINGLREMRESAGPDFDPASLFQELSQNGHSLMDVVNE